MEKWCDHCEIDKTGHSYLREGFFSQNMDNYDYCPRCGAKRPEPEKKKLTEKLCDAYYWDVRQPAWKGYEKYWESVAKTAIEEVKKIVDELNFGLIDKEEMLFHVVKTAALMKRLDEML